jgi:hypothetical protein
MLSIKYFLVKSIDYSNIFGNLIQCLAQENREVFVSTLCQVLLEALYICLIIRFSQFLKWVVILKQGPERLTHLP